MGLKVTEILLVLFVLLLLFGASRLPQMGSSLGAAIKNFKKGLSSDADEKAEGGKLPSGESASVLPSDKVANTPKQG